MGLREESYVVVIVGAGPSGLAVSACLSKKSIPYVILEKEDCCASLWKKHAYDRCHLHLAKEFCSLPYKPHSWNAKTYMPKNDFIRYVDNYVSEFNLRPRYYRCVESASYDESTGKWRVEATNTISNETEVYASEYLVVCTGENSKGYIPSLPGLESYKGNVVHSSEYKSGLEYQGDDVLVIGCGNSGMEISYDLASYGANTSIVIRNPFHVATRKMVRVGMHLLKYLPVNMVDFVIKFAEKCKYGDLSNFGIRRPKKGPFYLKATTGRSSVIDVGTVSKIKSGVIKVLPGISRINENDVIFEDGSRYHFDAIIFATGYKSTACHWLKDYEYMLNREGMPKNQFPQHWKGKNGLYCAGLARTGLKGVSNDAQAVARDIEASWRVRTLDSDVDLHQF